MSVHEFCKNGINQSVDNVTQEILGSDPNNPIYQQWRGYSKTTVDTVLITRGLAKKAISKVLKGNALGKIGKFGIKEEVIIARGSHLDLLSKSGQVLDRNGLTRAGRALDKHGGRPGSIFPKATGNSVNKNMQGQYHLDDILTHPQGSSKSNRFGGLDYYKPDGSGARFYNDGTFRGFLEPNS